MHVDLTNADSSSDVSPLKQKDNGQCGVRTSRRGPVPGRGRLKRKPSAELSQHPHSVKRRQRETAMIAIETQIEKAKKADRTAIRYRKRRLVKEPMYIDAGVDEKARMEDSIREDVCQKRYVYFLHPS